MSKDDLKTMGKTLGMQPDDVQSYLYNGTNVIRICETYILV